MVSVGVVEIGAAVESICVGGIDVGGRNGVGVAASPQAERMMSDRIRLKVEKKRLYIIA